MRVRVRTKGGARHSARALGEPSRACWGVPPCASTYNHQINPNIHRQAELTKLLINAKSGDCKAQYTHYRSHFITLISYILSYI